MVEATELAPHPRVVVGCDGSDTSVKALQWAARYAAQIGATVEVTTVWDWPTVNGAPVTVGWAGPDHYARKALKKSLQQAGIPANTVRVSVVKGHAGEELVRRSAGASMLVVGRSDRGRLEKTLLGSVSRHCLHHATCPVCVVEG